MGLRREGRIPKDKAAKYLPNLEDLYEVGLKGVGYSVVDATIAVTGQTDAQLIAAPPNTTSVPSGAVVHSLGEEPGAVFVMPRHTGGDPNDIDAMVQLIFMTANASAAFIRGRSWTGAQGGIGARVIAISP